MQNLHNGDRISRADAIEMLCKSCRHNDKEHYYPNCELQMCCDDINAINALPSADAESNDRISRTKLFNKLATVQAPPEANEYKAEVYKIIQSMGTEEENDDR